ncbi:MAG: peptidylprolyl isomerase [Gemmatimonadota bacterium]|jgi:hypothetical protein
MKLSVFCNRSEPRAAGYSAGAWRLVIIGLLLWAATGCHGKVEYALQVDGTGFTVTELGMLDGAQQSRLADLTAFGLAVAQGRTEAVTKPYVQADVQALLLQKLATEVAVRQSGQDEDQLRRMYQQHPEYELTVRHLVIVSERWRPQAQRDSARAEAAAALARIRAGEDFAKVASEVSQEPGAAESGGLLKPARKGDWVPEFWAAASALKVGQVSGVVETQYGFHVIKLIARRPIPFDEVRSSVLPRLVDLEAASGKAQAWAVRQGRAVKLHPTAISNWREGGPDSLTLASWPGGRLEGTDLNQYMLTLSIDEQARLESLDNARFHRVVSSVARNRLLAQRASQMGVTLTPAEQAGAAERWQSRVADWASSIGFHQGQSPKSVRKAAKDALGSSKQSVQIARAQVDSMSAALRAIYPVRFAGSSPP